jgi:hypothetical protein
VANLVNIPAIKDGDVHFTLALENGIQRFVVTPEALTDLARTSNVTDTQLLKLFESHRNQIFEVAINQLGQPGKETILLRSSLF